MILELPDKHVRKAVITALNGLNVSGFDIPTYDSRANDNAPSFYVLMTTQTNNEQKDNKCAPRWNSSILLDIITRYDGSGNMGSRLMADNIANEVMKRTDNLTLEALSGLEIKRQVLSLPNDITTLTSTTNIFRKLIRLELVIDKL